MIKHDLLYFIATFFKNCSHLCEMGKPKHLYNNIEWALEELVSYVEIVDSLNKINQITKDLKIKILLVHIILPF